MDRKGTQIGHIVKAMARHRNRNYEGSADYVQIQMAAGDSWLLELANWSVGIVKHSNTEGQWTRAVNIVGLEKKGSILSNKWPPVFVNIYGLWPQRRLNDNGIVGMVCPCVSLALFRRKGGGQSRRNLQIDGFPLQH